jgi:hypothetical protein
MGESAGQLELVDSRIDLRLADSAEYGGRDSGNDAYPSISALRRPNVPAHVRDLNES